MKEEDWRTCDTQVEERAGTKSEKVPGGVRSDQTRRGSTSGEFVSMQCTE